MKIALFGTSADPPTVGHQAILQWLSHHFDQVAVWASDNPFKSHQTPLSERMKMLQLIIDDLDIPQTNVTLREELSYPRSLEALEKAKEIWGEVEYYLVVGSDILGQIPSWYKARELLQKTKLLVIPRPGYPVEPEAVKQVSELGGEYVIADFVAPPTSSTAYREQGDCDVIPSPIEEYIQQAQLYHQPESNQD
jgi:nicotinate-nucleotide adenylyltransferase